MVKKRSQKGVENSGDKIENDTNVSNAENSNNANESEHKINIKYKNEFIYATPIKRIKKFFFPSTPKKKKRTKKFKGLKFPGRNLSTIFELI